MKNFISYIRPATDTDLLPSQNINKRSYGSLSQKMKCWNVHPITLPFTTRDCRGGVGGGACVCGIKQIQLKCLSKRKHSEKNKVKFSPTLQDERYLVTASNLS